MSLYRGTAWGPAVVLSLLAFDYACSGGSAGTDFGGGSGSTGSGAGGSTSGKGATSGNGTATASGNGSTSASGSAGGSGNGSSGSSSGGGSGSVATSGAGSGGGSGTPQGGADAGKTDAAAKIDSGPFVGADAGFLGMPIKGVAFAEGTAPCSDLTTLNLSWFYNWAARTSCNAGPAYVPMVWGDWVAKPSVALPQTVASAGFNIVLGFNEPDNAGQSNMTVARAIALWPQMLSTQPAFQRVGSPATSSAPTGMTWLDNFMAAAAAAALRVDFVAVHWYGIGGTSCATTNLLDAYITWAEHFGKPVWLTEFSCTDQTAAVVKAFYDGSIVMFAKHKLLERYAWFETRSGSVAGFANATLIDATGTLTPLGQDYAAAPALH